jgi:hypothetical protein
VLIFQSRPTTCVVGEDEELDSDVEVERRVVYKSLARKKKTRSQIKVWCWVSVSGCQDRCECSAGCVGVGVGIGEQAIRPLRYLLHSRSRS